MLQKGLRPFVYTDVLANIESQCTVATDMLKLLQPAVEAGTKRVHKDKWEDLRQKVVPLKIDLLTSAQKFKGIMHKHEYDTKKEPDLAMSQRSLESLQQDFDSDARSTHAAAGKLYVCFEGFVACEGFAHQIGTKLASPTLESHRTFPLTNFASVSLEDALDIVGNIEAIQAAHACSDVLGELPDSCKNLLEAAVSVSGNASLPAYLKTFDPGTLNVT